MATRNAAHTMSHLVLATTSSNGAGGNKKHVVTMLDIGATLANQWGRFQTFVATRKDSCCCSWTCCNCVLEAWYRPLVQAAGDLVQAAAGGLVQVASQATALTHQTPRSLGSSARAAPET